MAFDLSTLSFEAKSAILERCGAVSVQLLSALFPTETADVLRKKSRLERRTPTKYVGSTR